MERKLLPIGRQSFRDLREENCIYVDKTAYIYNFCTQGKMYFLSRPRRFGKSLLLSTLEALYSGYKDLFEGTWIVDKWDWTKKYPIIHISFNLVDYEENGLNTAIKRTLLKFYNEYDLIPSEDASIKILLADLLEQLYKKQTDEPLGIFYSTIKQLQDFLIGFCLFQVIVFHIINDRFIIFIN